MREGPDGVRVQHGVDIAHIMDANVIQHGVWRHFWSAHTLKEVREGATE